jgi:RNA polymerase sigma-70 factor (ECF subfamily)
VDGPEVALAIVDGLELDRSHLYHAVRADLLRRLGRNDDAILAYDAAIDRATNTTERAFLELQRQTPSHIQPDQGD